jgi:hypothetical protein
MADRYAHLSQANLLDAAKKLDAVLCCLLGLVLKAQSHRK